MDYIRGTTICYVANRATLSTDTSWPRCIKELPTILESLRILSFSENVVVTERRRVHLLCLP
jgi:hypothetical protein